MLQWKELHVHQVFQQPEFTHDEAHEAKEAHAKIKTILDNLKPQFHELQQLVETHVTAEENEVFPKLDDFMTRRTTCY